MSETKKNHDINDLSGKLEALLFVSSEPISFEELLVALNVSDRDLVDAIDVLEKRLDESESAIELRELSNGFQLFTKSCYFDFLDSYLSSEKKSKLSPATLETMAIVAYSQPITRSQVSQIRGVSSDAIISSLIARSLIEEVGRTEEDGVSLLGTTDDFLNLVGIMDINELPDLSQFAPDEETRLNIAEKISSLHENIV